MSQTTPFHDLSEYIALPRAGSLTMAPDGGALVMGVATLDAKKTAWVTALWRIDPTGTEPARRLTRGAKGESAAAVTDAGDLLFLAKRPGAEDDEDAPAALWLLPAAGGEPRIVATHPGGFSGVRARGNTLLATASLMPGASDLERDAALRKLRKENKVDAILHAGYPVRHWDHDLGPDVAHLYAASLDDLRPAGAAEEEVRLELRDLAPDVGDRLMAEDVDLAPDGSFVLATLRVVGERLAHRFEVVRIDVASGERTVVTGAEGVDCESPTIAPDGRSFTYVSAPVSTPEAIHPPELWLARSDGSEPRRLASDWDGWAGPVTWLPDSSEVLMVTDADGRRPVFRVALDGSAPVQLTDDGAFTDVFVAPDGSAAYALRSSYEHPADAVRLPLGGPPAEVAALRNPMGQPALPGTLTEVEAPAADGVRVRGWLCLPEGASPDAPAPLLLWIHGGPLGSWNDWSWRWCPWLMVAQGYAVLLPDPALSTGYGHDFVQRGWGRWGAEPFTDLMAITDAVVERPEIDATRTAAMGGSFGGYMANWVAGHTDRFDAIVTHASLWALDQFGPTTDHSYYWAREMTPAMAEANSPHRFVGDITTPMLVIHGDRDYRVPIGEGLRLWYELLTASGLPAGEGGETVHRFLYFPGENHWILSPQHAAIWYRVVFSFLGRHVLGRTDLGEPEQLGLMVAGPSGEDDILSPAQPPS